MGGLSQSDKLFGALLIAFLIYITVRGQLPAPNGYLGIFTHKVAPAKSDGGILGAIGGFFSNLLPNLSSGMTGGLDTALNILETFGPGL